MASGGDRQNNGTDSQSTNGGPSGMAEIGKLVSAVQASSDTTIVRIGQVRGKNVGSTVASVMGGRTTLSEGTKYIEAAQIGGTTEGGGIVTAAIDHTLVIPPAAAADERDEPSGRVQGNGKTVALLLSGAGTASGIKVFKGDVELMKTLLTSEKIGLSKDLVFSVCPNPDSGTQTTKKQTEKAIDDLKKKLGDSTDNNFIFYYSGHFSKTHQFKVDTRGDPSQNYYNDEDLARMLLTIPAKHVLLILDMCYSGSANVGAKDGDGLSETEDVGVEEILAKVPRLWEFMTSRKGVQAKGDPEMVVQWSSSRADQPSSYDQQSSYFTQAIVDVVTALDTNDAVKNELERGQTHATILQVHRQVDRHLREHNRSQRPIIKPDHADAEYFRSFPRFAKVN
ncbi:uncharacterized protein LOC124280573 isoform X5 [Haliotis rubra]|uniref:uncharacterized protein LOC124280573 isoform X5 n=1 Tax=Haliotis rubra TaxID=36100 RepID=UPI001EE5834A|nr:uncharacterized protein LOC124280573 isoform X5 [Haliotis rubra]